MPPPPDPRALLVVEDDDDDFQLLSDGFAGCGLGVPLERARDGEELLSRLAGGRPPALIILDLNLPKLAGLAALEEVKARPETKAVPVVILTTSGSGADVRRSFELGASSFFQKPATFGELSRFCALIKDYWFEASMLPEAGR